VRDDLARRAEGLPPPTDAELRDMFLQNLAMFIVAAILGNLLRGELTALLTNVIAAIGTAVLDPVLGCTNAIPPLDDFIADVEAHAGIDIANLWRGQHDVVNDAGELSSLARTLRFSLLRCAGGS
jgi:hypothetical protein